MWGLAVSALVAMEPSVSEAREVEVGAYLPPSPSDPGFVVFRASPRDTPALRAGKLVLSRSSFAVLFDPLIKSLSCWRILGFVGNGTVLD